MRIVSGEARGTKLKTLKGANTRPTLDRIKEALFNIINNKLANAKVLDLFAGSGSLGLEALSRGADFSVFCDNSIEAIKIIQENVEKTKFIEKSLIIKNDFTDALKILVTQEITFDIIFIDPPYQSNYRIQAIELILEKNLLKNDGIIIIETDDEQEIDKINNLELDLKIYDTRKYGRVRLAILRSKGVKRIYGNIYIIRNVRGYFREEQKPALFCKRYS